MDPIEPPEDSSWLPESLVGRAEWLPAEGERPEGMYISFGGNIGRTKVSLRFSGEELEPHVLTEALQCSPSRSYRKGDPVTRDGRGQRRRGMWLLESRLEESFSIDAHVGDVLSRVTNDLSVWTNLARFTPDVFCGLFLSAFNQGDTLAPATMQALAARGIRLGLDIYSNTGEE
ncbi:MAG TPA: DUF4279 domain-containing protein [Phycisphaerales bacterium]|nr:DUF4279 domain-containing protein [Phycisphaerales bacterium]